MCLFVCLFSRTQNPQDELSPCCEQLPKKRKSTGGRTRGASRVPGQRQPGPHLRRGGTLRDWTNQHLPALTWPLPAGSRELRCSHRRGELSRALSCGGGSFFTHLSPAMGLPSGSLASLLLCLLLLLQVPHCVALARTGTLPGGRAGSACGGGVGVRESAGLGTLRPR